MSVVWSSFGMCFRSCGTLGEDGSLELINCVSCGSCLSSLVGVFSL